MSLYRNPLLIAYGNFAFRYRNYLFPAALVALCAAFLPAYPGGDEALDHWLDLGAVGLAIVGEGIRAATVGLEYIKRGGVDKRVFADKLVTNGMFAHARNPLYVGNLLMVFALLVIVNRAPVYLIGGAFVLITYIALVAAEERYLREKFGAAYEDYCARVNRWLPRLSGLGETFRSMRFNWRRVLGKEYSNVYSWSFAALALELTETLIQEGPAGDDGGFLVLLGVLWLLVSLATLIVWRFKKSGALSGTAA